MYSANVVETFIATPSDVIQERRLIREIVSEWNIINSKSKKVLLQVLGWENDVYSSVSEGSAQSTINKQILNESDLLIGVFWTRIGTNTKEYLSGSVEEINKHIESNKPVMLFFSNMPVTPDSIKKEQYDKLLVFKAECQEKGLVNSYDNIEDFTKKFRSQLGLFRNKNEYFNKLISEKNANDDSINMIKNIFSNDKKIVITDEAKSLLKEVSLDRNGTLWNLKTNGGPIIQTNGKNLGPEKYDHRREAELNAIIEELENNNLIKAKSYKRQGFTITAEGYELIDNIKN